MNERFHSSQVLPLQFLHFSSVGELGCPFAWDDELRSAKRSRGLLNQLGLGVESNLIEDEDLGGNEPNRQTNYQSPERKWTAIKGGHSRTTERSQRVAYFHLAT
jgi:hypothetical protein